jgi:hypothetical protein
MKIPLSSRTLGRPSTTLAKFFSVPPTGAKSIGSPALQILQPSLFRQLKFTAWLSPQTGQFG